VQVHPLSRAADSNSVVRMGSRSQGKPSSGLVPVKSPVRPLASLIFGAKTGGMKAGPLQLALGMSGAAAVWRKHLGLAIDRQSAHLAVYGPRGPLPPSESVKPKAVTPRRGRLPKPAKDRQCVWRRPLLNSQPAPLRNYYPKLNPA
jgi:hypothetical protein